jgi:hypothetical protein
MKAWSIKYCPDTSKKNNNIMKLKKFNEYIKTRLTKKEIADIAILSKI